MAKFALGRRVAPDANDRKFLMRRKLAAPGTPLPIRKTWRIPAPSQNQQDTSCCVGFAWSNFLRCAPVCTQKGPSPFDIYRYAVARDEWPDNDREAYLPDWDRGLASGTTVRAGASLLVKEFRLGTYLWAFDLQSAVEWVLTKGPVVMGTNWYDSMFEPDRNGLAKITPRAEIAGGHAYLLRGVDRRTSIACFENSWGDGWGKNGAFYLSFADLERLIHEQGEACTATEEKLKPTKL